ncbi:MAG: PIG-L family deacetylase [Anaerolineae bacterium]
MTQPTTASQRLMTIFAHPDDEVGVGGVLAQAAQAGAQVTLVCATRGEAATIYSPPDYGATPETLGEVRTRELECCRDALGAQQVLWLDWPDGGVAQVERADAVARVVLLLRRWQPQIVITHPADGGYPHPDHIAVHEIVMAAWRAAADLEFRPDLGAAWAVSKVYARVMPQSIFDSVPGFADFRVQLNGAQLPFFAVPDDEISTVVDVTPWVDQRLAAWDCHRSQHNPEGMWSGISEEQRRTNASRETLQLLATHLPGEAVSLPEADIWAGIEAEAGVDLTPEAEPDAVDAATVARLVAALRGRRTYLEIYQKYRRFRPKPVVVELLATLIDHTQEMIALLSSALRRMDYSPKQVGINEKLFEQATRRRNDAGKLTFLIVGSEKNLIWYTEQMAQGDPPAVQALWQELISFETADQEQIRQTLARIETATGQVPGAH